MRSCHTVDIKCKIDGEIYPANVKMANYYRQFDINCNKEKYFYHPWRANCFPEGNVSFINFYHKKLLKNRFLQYSNYRNLKNVEIFASISSKNFYDSAMIPLYRQWKPEVKNIIKNYFKNRKFFKIFYVT